MQTVMCFVVLKALGHCGKTVGIPLNIANVAGLQIKTV
jgi:hypothetical protein